MVSLEYEMKLERFEEEIKDEKTINRQLKILFSNEYDEIIGDILNLKEELFIDQVKEGVSLLLEDFYTDSCLSDERLSRLVENNLNEIKSKYKHDYGLINKVWMAYEKTSKRRTNTEMFLSNFRKHCLNAFEHASHNCCLNEKDGERKSHFITVNSDNKKGIKFVVCENCKKVYYSSYILARCYKCKVDYYTNLLSSEENPELLVATWENYHCPQLINEKMKCIKCHEPFFLNMKTGLLECLNKKCGFVSKPTRILWTCSVCKTEFKSGAIPYNPLEIEVTRRLVSQTLLLKHKAHPNKMPCCKLNVFFTDFHHKHNCDGILYESDIDDNKIIVCEKCKAINYYDRFHWTCPKCGKRFKDTLNDNKENSQHNSFHNSPNLRIKEKEPEEKDNNKIHTPQISQYSRKRVYKKEKELKEFKLNEKEKDNNMEEENDNNNDNDKKEKEKEEEKKKIDTEKKPIDSPRKYRRFHISNKHMNLEDNNDKAEEDKKNEENKIEENHEEKNEEENDDGNYRKNRSRTAYNKSGKNEGRRVFRRFRHEKEKEEKPIIEETEEKEKEKEKEKEEEGLSQRMQWRKRYKREHVNSNKDLPIEKDKQSEEIEREEKEKKEKEENESKNKNKEENANINLSGRSWFRRIKSPRNTEKEEREEKERKEKEEKEKKEKEEREEKERKEKEEKERKEKERKEKESTKSTKKEKEADSVDNEEESDEENNSIDNNDEDIHEIIKFGNNDSSDEEEEDYKREEKENPVDPDPLYMNYKFKRNKNKKKTKGMEIIGDNDNDESKEDNIEMINKKKSAPQIKIAMSKIPGISEHLFNHIKKRMTTILNRCKIPVFNVEDYIFNKKLGEGSYAVIFSVYKNDDKDRKQLALKKIIAKTLTEIDKFTKEFELVHSCIHPNIMKIYGICIRMLDQTTYALYVLMELSYCDWDKEIKMHIMKKKNYTEAELINILRQLTSALLFMQQNLKISHRDIKPQNVLLFPEGNYKIADFGEAKEAKMSKQVNTLRGTELYMSPALYSGLKNDKNDVNHDPYKSDVFSLGFCFFYASTLNFNVLYQVREIYNSNRMNDIIEQQLKKKYSEIFISILKNMMEVDESERFDFPKLVDFIDANYDKKGNLKNIENSIDKKGESSHRSIKKK